MATLSENLQIIKNSTDAIKQAIIDKGGEISGDITTWADAISGLSGGGGSSSTEITFTGNIYMHASGDDPVTFDITGYISSTLDIVGPKLVAIYIPFANPSIAMTNISDTTDYLSLYLNTNLTPDMINSTKIPQLYLASAIDNTIYPVTFIYNQQGGPSGGSGI